MRNMTRGSVQLRSILNRCGSGLFASLLLLSGVMVFAQGRPNDRYPEGNNGRYSDRDNDRDSDRTDNGVSAGGKWMAYRPEDRMTPANRVDLQLSAETANSGDDHA